MGFFFRHAGVYEGLCGGAGPGGGGGWSTGPRNGAGGGPGAFEAGKQGGGKKKGDPGVRAGTCSENGGGAMFPGLRGARGRAKFEFPRPAGLVLSRRFAASGTRFRTAPVREGFSAPAMVSERGEKQPGCKALTRELARTAEPRGCNLERAEARFRIFFFLAPGGLGRGARGKKGARGLQAN